MNKNMKRLFAVILVILVTTMSSCGKKESNVAETGQTSGTTNSLFSENDFYESEKEVYGIKTPYVMLMYPTIWKDLVSTTIDEFENGCSVEFTANLGGVCLGLYTITIADESDGYCLGVIQTDLGEKKVYLTDQYDELSETLSEELQMTYRDMCYDVNVIISKLVYENGMILF